ncbi:phospholipase-like protein, partial [Tanacetum coccineum]
MEGHKLHFGHREFSLITGFHFGTVSFDLHSSGELKFWNRVFPNNIGFSITNLDIIGVIEDEEIFGRVSDDDAILWLKILKPGIHFLGVSICGVMFVDGIKNVKKGMGCRLEEENMLQLEQQKKNKQKEFMNSNHCKNLLSKLASAKRIQLCSSSEKIQPKVSWVKIKKYRQQVYDPCTTEFLKTVKPWVEDTSRVLQSMDTVWNFWLKLVCLDPARKGWLTEKHIDLWVDYMWHVRPENSNWAMVSCYFVQLLLQNGMPLFYANGERYTTTWSEVDQVLIPIYEMGEHWCLSQFHIMSAEVTFYDTGHTYDYDYRD